VYAAGKWNASWKRRFFVLVDSDFIYYEDAKQAKRKGSIDISTVTELKVSCLAKAAMGTCFTCSLPMRY